jgi:K(+)-stimulated pyrophosphate-energized sodium pump
LFGLLAVPLAVSLKEKQGEHITLALAVVFLGTAMLFVHRSFYGMRIRVEGEKPRN